MPIIAEGGADILVAINGTNAAGLLHASVSTRNCFSADSYALTFALGPFPLSDIEAWASTASGYVEISTGRLGGMSKCLITGFIDTVVMDPVHQTVSIEGRDLSSSMIDSYRQQDFVNQTASEVVAHIAQSHNLTPVVTPTSEVVGRYYGDGYTRLSLGQFSRLRSDWDLVVQLARENKFDVFVQDQTLFFQPSIPPMQSPIEIPISDVKELRVERSLSITGAPLARVQSWNSQNMVSVDSRVTGTGVSSTPTGTGSFLFSGANLTASQVTGSAERYSAELNRLGTSLHLEMPWRLSLEPRQDIWVSGAGLPLDNVFKIESIERQYSSIAGSKQRIRAAKLI